MHIIGLNHVCMLIVNLELFVKPNGTMFPKDHNALNIFPLLMVVCLPINFMLVYML